MYLGNEPYQIICIKKTTELHIALAIYKGSNKASLNPFHQTLNAKC